MARPLPDVDFDHFWRRLQQLGLNAYEARAYMVLVGNSRLKALDVAGQAQVPRQKIYEVLDCLIEKGFAQVVQDRTKLFSAVAPNIAIPTYLARRQQEFELETMTQSRVASILMEDLARAWMPADGRGTLDYLTILTDPRQVAAHYRRLLNDCRTEYLEFVQPPFAVDPLEEKQVRQARARGVGCRLLVEDSSLDEAHRQRLREYSDAGIEVCCMPAVPLKLALFDGEHGLIALLDPRIARPSWTTLLFSHAGMGEAMRGLFLDYWGRSQARAAQHAG